MTNEAYRQMWQELGMDLRQHDLFLAALPEAFNTVFLSQSNRPQGMAYFDNLLMEAHGGRIREILDRKKEGKPVVGTFCVFVPEELIFAIDGVSVGLCGGAQFTVPAGERVLPRNLCPLIKSLMGFKLERICPYFQAVDFLIGETTCDGKKKTWEILNEYVPTYVMELPQRKEEPDLALWEREIWRLKKEVERRSGQIIDEEKLARGIRRANARREALRRLYKARQADPVPISGKDVLLISQLAFFDEPERFAARVNELCEELEGRMARGEGVAPKGAIRIVVAGTPMPIPYWKLHHIVESAGAVIVAEETCTGTRYFAGQVEEGGETLEQQLKALARRFLDINCACFTPNSGRVEDILNLAREWRAHGVIYYTLQFCQTYALEARRVEKALKERGIPVLTLESDYSEEDVGQLKTRIEAFLEMLN
ncbi:Benzoyl-CoA reductase/2-hydroxyglutaryl-CoA dehydratase subunit, BcrC/BadD/HgdB [Thermanaeromonas toyohensis ToBE]|uniref:Benzoyl-CoA reductase/2-hydroxyglutaryl-CoA dehydratase subunit, BcrC/BadD/HgdB n=1 Tax=Thermanaeromonas toyohensis ToBE TaxID=698762 RepID=A0A1W1VDQ4_9FIRM|nr:double-cubane-cluster-containing anaerobic reductase [Thermanaeromonas toyohensis]SMB91330.1 Benzoyl-CoA reductase/2-hydroxyglutaryl-CoA dehydratase subunit, BcrC/BadD/HgdB [Thermanaeromonas toyohensis ToBE]